MFTLENSCSFPFPELELVLFLPKFKQLIVPVHKSDRAYGNYNLEDRLKNTSRVFNQCLKVHRHQLDLLAVEYAVESPMQATDNVVLDNSQGDNSTGLLRQPDFVPSFY